eukprot:CAMPEP_0170567972 /NCGR_PEP_ID=MMETSP0211-20121228/80831_1 /TAXON_ID=311385 /ORGANISM="Pseudokeronopsis sp., Strain OXSARD2" /LENGTH=44 /DNA_ID= /DNA_START= /DNA_END= /DNA_ORIENTATION=
MADEVVNLQRERKEMLKQVQTLKESTNDKKKALELISRDAEYDE